MLTKENWFFFSLMVYWASDKEKDQRGPGERLWKRTVKHVN